MDDFSVNRNVRAGDGFAFAGGDDPDFERSCPYCWDGSVFIGHLDYDGVERYDAIRCRKCRGTGVLSS